MAAGEADEIIGNCAFRPVETGLFLCFPKRLLCGWREASGKVRTMSAELKTGAEMLIRALKDQGVDVIFGYPGGAVLPIYDALFQQNDIQHILVRQEGGAVQDRKSTRLNSSH